MAQVVLELRGAVEVRAARHDLALEPHGLRPADRAVLRGASLARAPSALLEHDLHHLRDHVAGALHHDGVADAHVLALDLVLVVERGVRDRDPADVHGPACARAPSHERLHGLGLAATAPERQLSSRPQGQQRAVSGPKAAACHTEIATINWR